MNTEQTVSAMMKVALDDLPLFWRARAQAFDLLDKEFPDKGTRARAEAYKECADDLKAALEAAKHRPSTADLTAAIQAMGSFRECLRIQEVIEAGAKAIREKAKVDDSSYEECARACLTAGLAIAATWCPSCKRFFPDGGTCPRGGCPMGGDF